ncbi:MAG: NupC/NupG family nucleoside CNT transporter [Alphaproteobacteria bacterium]|nr:NupC/NupG family nucleoside CNT transporter [Alphaproteobacteria bacterium]
MALIFALAVFLSTNRKAIRPRVVGAAFSLQAGFAALVLWFPPGNIALQEVAGAVTSLLGYARAGTQFVFGPLADDRLGQSFALNALPTIVFFAALIGVLYHLGVMPLAIRWLGGGLKQVTGISRIESLYAAANIFVGQSESPLVVRPYLERLGASQMFCLMTIGMAGVAGTILALYASIGVRVDYLVAAAFMSAPAGVAMAKIIMPDPPETAEAPQPDADIVLYAGEERAANVIMAAGQGAMTGLKLAAAVGAMVLAFVALIALANGMVGWLGGMVGLPDVTAQQIAGYVFAPVFWLLGTQDWAEAVTAGSFFATKLVLNEVVAFMALADVSGLSERMQAVTIFAICGFANFSSIAIQMAVIGNLAPGQTAVVARLGLRALAAASLANLTSGALAGLFLIR